MRSLSDVPAHHYNCHTTPSPGRLILPLVSPHHSQSQAPPPSCHPHYPHIHTLSLCHCDAIPCLCFVRNLKLHEMCVQTLLFRFSSVKASVGRVPTLHRRRNFSDYHFEFQNFLDWKTSQLDVCQSVLAVGEQPSLQIKT